MFSKSKKQTEYNYSQKQITLLDQCYIIQKIARIDGNETIKKYKKCQLLGKGGFANCFVSQNVQTKRRAATKIIQKQLLTSQKTKLRLLNQIRLHKTLHHENVVQFQHYFQDKSNVYIFLQLCQNQSLNQIIKIRQYFTTSQIQFFMLGIVKGIQYLHSKQIIHRDLKLGNIFLDKQFNIKIGDFGLATKLEFKKQCKRTICGTPNYIAPEILQGKGYHFEVDIWSIGVILYTLYYTIPPFQTEQAATTYQKIKKVQYNFPKYAIVPPQAIDLIRRILVKNPSERPTLEDILNSEFMKMSNKIYKELPSVCAKRTPMKKDFLNTPFFTHQEALKQFLKITNSNKIVESSKTLHTKQKHEQKIIFVRQLDSLDSQKYFYELSDGTVSIFTNNEIVFKDLFGVIKSIDLKTLNSEAKIQKDHPLKYLLNCKTKLKSSIKQVKGPFSINQEQTMLQTTFLELVKIPVYIKKIAEHKKNNFQMIRLSNQSIQLLFADRVDYLILKKDSEIKQIKNGQINHKFSLNLKDLDQQKTKQLIDETKLKYIKGILSKIESLKQKIMSKSQNQKQNLDLQSQKLYETTISNHDEATKQQLFKNNINKQT